MPSAVASLPPTTPTAVPQPPPTAIGTTTQPNQFQTVLGQAVATAANAQNTNQNTNASPAAKAAAQSAVGVDDTANGTNPNPNDNTAALIAAGLLAAPPGAIPQDAAQANAAANATTTGIAATPTTPPTATLSRAEQEQLRLAPIPPQLRPNQPAAPAQQPALAAAQPAAATPTAQPATALQVATAPGTAVPTGTVATPANPTATIPVGQNPGIPAQAPVVTDIIPPPGFTPPAAPTPPTVAPTESVAALPGVPVGERPAMAGDRFAAVISTANRVAAGQAAALPDVFAGMLADATTAQAVTPPTGLNAAAGVLPNLTTATGPAARLLLTAEEKSAEQTTRTGAETAAVPNPGLIPTPAPTGQSSAAQPAAVPQNTTPAGVQVADGIVAHVQAIDHGGTTEFRMRLDPPDLGQVRVHLMNTGDEVRGHVVVADDAVRQMIESQLPELRQRLEAAGVTVGRFDVSTDPGAGGNGTPHHGHPAAAFADSSIAAPRAARTAFRPAVASAAGHLDVTV